MHVPAACSQAMFLDMMQKEEQRQREVEEWQLGVKTYPCHVGASASFSEELQPGGPGPGGRGPAVTFDCTLRRTPLLLLRRWKGRRSSNENTTSSWKSAACSLPAALRNQAGCFVSRD